MRFLEVARRALEVSPEGDYCVLRYDEYGNAHHGINWGAIRRIYGCAIYVRPPHYSRRLIVVPGAVIAYSTDGPHRRCAVYRTLDVLREVDEHWEVHVDEWPPNDIERAKAVCLR
jgi:hypothetical protein